MFFDTLTLSLGLSLDLEFVLPVGFFDGPLDLVLGEDFESDAGFLAEDFFGFDIACSSKIYDQCKSTFYV